MKLMRSTMVTVFMATSSLLGLECKYETVGTNRSMLLYSESAPALIRFTPASFKKKVVTSVLVATVFLAGSGGGLYHYSHTASTPVQTVVPGLPNPDSFGIQRFTINADRAGQHVGSFGPTCSLYNTTSPVLQSCPPSVHFSFDASAFNITADDHCKITTKTCPCRSDNQVEQLLPQWCATIKQTSLPQTVQSSLALRLRATIKPHKKARTRKV